MAYTNKFPTNRVASVTFQNIILLFILLLFLQYGDSGRVGVAAGGMGQGNQRLADWLDEEDEEEQMCEPPNLKTAVDTLKGYYTPYKRKRCR